MEPTTEILRALVSAGYLEETSVETARTIIAAKLWDEDAVAARAEALRNESQQQQMITGAHQYAEQDAAMGDKRDLSIDRSIIQEAIDKKEVDEATLHHAEKKIAAACKSAAKSLAHARLIDKTHEKDVADLIQKTWIESSS